MCRKQFGQKTSEVSSVPPVKINERTTNAFVDSSSPFQTQLCEYATIQQNLKRMTESRLHLCGKFVDLYSSTWKRFQNRCE